MDDVYKQIFVQRLEKLNIEFMGRLLDSETHRAIAENRLIEMQNLYDESQRQVELQNDMMKQAASSIETQTIDSSRNEKKIKDLEQKLEEKEQERMALYYESKEKSDRIENLVSDLSQVDMYKNELNSTRAELNATYAELQETKTQLEKYMKKK